MTMGKNKFNKPNNALRVSGKGQNFKKQDGNKQNQKQFAKNNFKNNSFKQKQGFKQSPAKNGQQFKNSSNNMPYAQPKKPFSKNVPKKDVDYESEEEVSEESDDAAVVQKSVKATPKQQKKATQEKKQSKQMLPAEDSDEEEEEESEASDEEMELDEPASKNLSAKKQANEESESEEEEEEDDDEDESEDEEVQVEKKSKPAPSSADKDNLVNSDGDRDNYLISSIPEGTKNEAIKKFLTNKGVKYNDVVFANGPYYVVSMTKDEAKKASDVFASNVFMSTKLKLLNVASHGQSAPNVIGADTLDKKALFISNVPNSSDLNDVKAIIPNVAELVNAEMLPTTNKLAGKKIILRFKSENSAAAALRKINSAKMGNNSLSVKYLLVAMPHNDEMMARTIRGINLPYTFTQSDILKTFPTAIGVVLFRNNKGISRGAFNVAFATVEEAKKVHKENQKLTIQGRHIGLRFKETGVEQNAKKRGLEKTENEAITGESVNAKKAKKSIEKDAGNLQSGTKQVTPKKATVCPSATPKKLQKEKDEKSLDTPTTKKGLSQNAKKAKADIVQDSDDDDEEDVLESCEEDDSEEDEKLNNKMNGQKKGKEVKTAKGVEALHEGSSEEEEEDDSEDEEDDDDFDIDDDDEEDDEEVVPKKNAAKSPKKTVSKTAEEESESD